MPNDDLKKLAKQAVKDAKKDLRKGLNEAPKKDTYESTPMKNAAIDYIKSKEMYKGSALKGSEYNK